MVKDVFWLASGRTLLALSTYLSFLLEAHLGLRTKIPQVDDTACRGETAWLRSSVAIQEQKAHAVACERMEQYAMRLGTAIVKLSNAKIPEVSWYMYEINRRQR